MPERIPIHEAARICRRSVWTLRQWSIRGYAPNGMELHTYRDQVTKIRYFEVRQVERIAGALLPAERISP